MFKYSKITAGLAVACLAFSLSAQAKVTVFAAASIYLFQTAKNG